MLQLTCLVGSPWISHRSPGCSCDSNIACVAASAVLGTVGTGLAVLSALQQAQVNWNAKFLPSASEQLPQTACPQLSTHTSSSAACAAWQRLQSSSKSCSPQCQQRSICSDAHLELFGCEWLCLCDLIWCFAHLSAAGERCLNTGSVPWRS